MIAGGTRYTDGEHILTLKLQEWDDGRNGYNTITEDIFAPVVSGYDRYMGAYVVAGRWTLKNMLHYAMEWEVAGNTSDRIVFHELEEYPTEVYA